MLVYSSVPLSLRSKSSNYCYPTSSTLSFRKQNRRNQCLKQQRTKSGSVPFHGCDEPSIPSIPGAAANVPGKGHWRTRSEEKSGAYQNNGVGRDGGQPAFCSRDVQGIRGQPQPHRRGIDAEAPCLPFLGFSEVGILMCPGPLAVSFTVSFTAPFTALFTSPSPPLHPPDFCFSPLFSLYALFLLPHYILVLSSQRVSPIVNYVVASCASS